MRLETVNQPYCGLIRICDTTCECPIDVEYNLPDYCADIQKILKCIVSPEITAVHVEGDHVTVEGTAELRMFYVDAKGVCVRGFESHVPFSASVRMNETGEHPVAKVVPTVGHMTCRAMNARRVDFHITLNLSVAVSALRTEQTASAVSCDTVETLSDTYPVHFGICSTTHSFVLEENCTLDNRKPPIETLLRRAVEYRIERVQLFADEVSFSGKAVVCVLYRAFSDHDEPEFLRMEIPFSETVPCRGVQANHEAEVFFLCGSVSIQPKEDSMGENTILNVYLKPEFGVLCTGSGEVSCIQDVYATAGTLSAKFRQMLAEQRQRLSERAVRLKEPLRLPSENLARVIDLWPEGLTVSAFPEKESVLYRGHITICVLYRTEGGKVEYAEKRIDFTDSDPQPVAGKRQPCPQLQTLQYTITGADALEVTAEIRITDTAVQPVQITTLELADLEPEEKGDAAAAAVYYASSGERVWDIAKRYKAKMDVVRRWNNCTEEQLEEDRPILILRT